MSHTYFIPAGSTWRAMIERDLAHIEHVLLHTSDDVLERTALPLIYWRERLRQIKDGGQLFGHPLEKLNGLLLVLDRKLGNRRATSTRDAGQKPKNVSS